MTPAERLAEAASLIGQARELIAEAHDDYDEWARHTLGKMGAELVVVQRRIRNVLQVRRGV